MNSFGIYSCMFLSVHVFQKWTRSGYYSSEITHRISNYFLILICNMAQNLIAIKKLCLTKVRNSSQTLVYIFFRNCTQLNCWMLDSPNLSYNYHPSWPGYRVLSLLQANYSTEAGSLGDVYLFDNFSVSVSAIKLKEIKIDYMPHLSSFLFPITLQLVKNLHCCS